MRVQTTMTDKVSHCIKRVRDYIAHRDVLEKEKNFLGQATGTKNCLEMIREEGTDISQELIDIFVEQEKHHATEVAKLTVGPLPEEVLLLSPLVFPSRFLSEEFMATLDPYRSNDDLVGSESASLLRTLCDILEGTSTKELMWFRST